jgi:hypothetical protein
MLWTRDAQNAAAIGSLFGNGQVAAGTAAYNDTSTALVVANPLGAAVDFAIIGHGVQADGTLRLASSNTTSLTFARTATTNDVVVSFIVGINA